MGWQLVPTGIGWREFSKTLEEGMYECPNDRCKGRRDPQQAYRHRRGRNWFTVLFIPIIPLNVTGEYVQCRRCKSIFPTAVLAGARNRPAPAEAVRPTSRAADPVPSQPVVDVPPPQPAVSHPDPVPPPADPAPLAPQMQPSPPSTGDWWDESPDDPHDDAPVAPRGPVERSSGVMDEPTVARLSSSTGGGHLVFGSGGRVPLLAAVVVGRNPTLPDEFAHGLPVSVADSTMTVSKTHAVFGRDGDGPWVADLGSANGVVVSTPGEPDVELRSNRAHFEPGATIRLGELAVHLEGAAASPTAGAADLSDHTIVRTNR